MINIQTQPSFTGTYLSSKSKLPVSDYEKMFKDHYSIKPLHRSDNPSKTLKQDEVGIQTTKNGIKFVGQNEEDDKNIYKLLTEFDKDAEFKYVEEDWSKLNEDKKLDINA